MVNASHRTGETQPLIIPLTILRHIDEGLVALSSSP